MNQQLNEIKEALKAATPGPWVIAPDRTISGLYDIGGRYGLTAQTDHSDNAHLIANAPQWLTSLVSEVERLDIAAHIDVSLGNTVAEMRQENELLKSKVEEMQKIIDTAVMFLKSNELNIKAEQIKAMVQSLKGDKP